MRTSTKATSGRLTWTVKMYGKVPYTYTEGAPGRRPVVQSKDPLTGQLKGGRVVGETSTHVGSTVKFEQYGGFSVVSGGGPECSCGCPWDECG